MRVNALNGRRSLSAISLMILVGFLALGPDTGTLLGNAWADEPEDGSPEYYLKLAQEGDADAQYTLANIYRNGQGVSQDPVEAAKWMRKAADNGNIRAQNDLGVMYTAGEGVRQDEGQAVKWFTKSADQGNADAQYLLGIMYADGWGVAKDESEAVKWYRKSADQGHQNAKARLKEMEGTQP